MTSISPSTLFWRAAWTATLVLLALGTAARAVVPPDYIADDGSWSGPTWRFIEYDCVTGDHFVKEGSSGDSSCDGTNGKPALPQNKCYQPDIVAEGTIRCDQWEGDFWERPFSGEFFPDVDLVYVLATEDDDFWYFLLQLYGLRGGSKLDALYGVEIDADSDDPSDYRPGPGLDPEYPDGVSCSDWWVRSASPTANIAEKVGWDDWGQDGVIASHDDDDDVGGCHCARHDDPAKYAFCDDKWSGSGYEGIVADQGGGTIPDGAWAMMPSNCSSLTTSYVDLAELQALGLTDTSLVDFDGTCVVLAVKKTMIGTYRFDGAVPQSFRWRAIAEKGNQDPANVQQHDKYSHSESGDSFVDEEFWPLSGVKESDSSARLGALHLFSQCSVEAEGDPLTVGASQSFTGPLVPQAHPDLPRSVFFADFIPLESGAHWPSNLLGFISPVPVVEDADGHLVADPSQTCEDAEDTGCLAWNAAAELLAQAPTPDEVTTDRRIGPLPTERRVSYSVGAGSMPRPSRTFDYPVASADEVDLWQGLGIAFDPSDESSMAAARAEAEGIIRQTLQIKTVPDPQMVGSEIDFVAGDVFHAEPLLLRQPDRFAYLANDLESNGKACNDATDPNPGYRCFFERHRRRRQVLIAGSNDGQLHAFEAGRFDGGVSGGRVTGVYDRGTGGELFAHIPRPMLQHVAEMTLADHGFGIDLAPVADDVFVDPSHGGTPTPADREWRTVVFGGYRSGGPGIFALDLTQPDHLSERTVTNLAGQTDVAYLPVRGDDYVPSCNTAYSAESCGALPYPAVLWEFSDQCVDGSTSTLVPCDDDGNGQPDLGLSWSKVNSGRVRVTAGDDVETRYVVVFGGGIDPDNPDVVGNFLYMVDVETGETLYKRAVVGAVPGEPAAVDSDGDTFLDTVYVGTTAGKLYKADISAAATLDATTGRVAATDWALFEVFDTGGRPIFYPPAVLFVASRDAFALAFGTGHRLELFADQSPAGGRLYLVLDDGLAASDPELPLTAAQFPAVVAATDPNTADNFLLAPEPDKSAGWVLELAANERLVSDVLAISGVLSFATFLPSTDPTTCAGAGDGSIYSLLATNANGLGTRPRSATFADKFVNAPRVIPSSSSETVLGEGVVDPFATTDMRAVSQSLQTLFPDRCRFGNFGQRLSTTLTDTGQVAVVEIPVCVLPKNWKEF